MNELMQNLSSPAWWFTVVVAGVIVSAAGTVLKERLEKWGSSVSSGARRRRQANAERFERRVAALIASPYLREKSRFEVLRNLIVSLIFFALSILVFVLGVFVAELGGAARIRFLLFAPASLAFAYATAKLLQDTTYIELEAAEERLAAKQTQP